MNSNIVFQIRGILQNAQSLLIAIPKNPSDDVMGAALALYLIVNKMHKQVAIVSPTDVPVGQAHFYGVNKISRQISGSNALVVSLPYKEGTIEKVSYNIENSRFNLVIEPRGEAITFSTDEIEYNFGKGDYDTVLVMGVQVLNDLGELYQNHKNIFQGKTIINIDNSVNNTKFGQLNIVEEGPISQIMTNLVKSLRLPIDADQASNLYSGIISSGMPMTIETASPDALEAIAFLLRNQAKDLTKTQKREQQVSNGSNKQSTQGNNNVVVEQTKTNTNGQNTQSVQEDETPEDWLKPKIFSSRNN